MGIKLSTADRWILFFAEHQHDISVRELAAKLDVREHVVRHALKNLQTKGLLRPEIAVDQAKLGWMSACVHLSIQSRRPDDQSRLITTLVRSPRTTWLAEMGGLYQFETTILAKHEREILKFLDELSEITGLAFSKKSIAIETSFLNFGSKFLVNATEPAYVPVEANVSHEHVEIDELDQHILWTMCNTKYSSFAHIARTLGISNTTLEFRVTRLQNRGIIHRKTFVIDHAQYGAEFFYIFFNAQANTSNFRHRLTSFCRTHPNVSILIRALGAYDYQLIIPVENMGVAAGVAKALEHRFEGEISELMLVPRFRVHKHRSYPCHPDWLKQDVLFLHDDEFRTSPRNSPDFSAKRARESTSNG